jgi:hypothetical protein
LNFYRQILVSYAIYCNGLGNSWTDNTRCSQVSSLVLPELISLFLSNNQCSRCTCTLIFLDYLCV